MLDKISLLLKQKISNYSGRKIMQIMESESRREKLINDIYIRIFTEAFTRPKISDQDWLDVLHILSKVLENIFLVKVFSSDNLCSMQNVEKPDFHRMIEAFIDA